MPGDVDQLEGDGGEGARVDVHPVLLHQGQTSPLLYRHSEPRGHGLATAQVIFLLHLQLQAQSIAGAGEGGLAERLVGSKNVKAVPVDWAPNGLVIHEEAIFVVGVNRGQAVEPSEGAARDQISQLVANHEPLGLGELQVVHQERLERMLV